MLSAAGKCTCFGEPVKCDRALCLKISVYQKDWHSQNVRSESVLNPILAITDDNSPECGLAIAPGALRCRTPGIYEPLQVRKIGETRHQLDVKLIYCGSCCRWTLAQTRSQAQPSEFSGVRFLGNLRRDPTTCFRRTLEAVCAAYAIALSNTRQVLSF